MIEIKFHIEPSTELFQAHNEYIPDEWSFNPKGELPDGASSLAVNNLQLEMDYETGQVLYAWGYCAYTIWKATDKVPPPGYVSAALFAEINDEILPGMSYRVTEPHTWPMEFNNKERWFCIGDVDAVGDVLVEFARNSIAVLKENELKAVWLRLDEVPDELKSIGGAE